MDVKLYINRASGFDSKPSFNTANPQAALMTGLWDDYNASMALYALVR
jgi:hypothetical protein